MLVLSRKKGESVIIQDNIEITVLEVTADTIKLGFQAPREVDIVRKELVVLIEETNKEAANQSLNVHQLKERINKAQNKWNEQ